MKLTQATDEAIRDLVAIVDERFEATCARDVLGRVHSDAPTLTEAERDAVLDVIDPDREFSDNYRYYAMSRMIERIDQIGDGLED